MSNRLTNIKLSETFYKHIASKARSEERSVASYIRNAVKSYSGYTSDTLHKNKAEPIVDVGDIDFEE